MNTFEFENFFNENIEEVYSLINAASVISAPSHNERNKALFCLEWLCKNVDNSAYIDSDNNVVIHLGDKNKKAVLICAHTDIVFDKNVLLKVTQKDGKTYCPGIGDNTASVAILMVLAKFIKQNEDKLDRHFIISANSQEEGEGNLKGAYVLYERYGNIIDEMYSFDGYIDVLHTKAVGSIRYKIKSDTLGGHSFRDYGRENAIETLTKVLNALSKIRLPKKGITTKNIGKISGGTTVNSIASHAEALFEFRSDTYKNLCYLSKKTEKILASFAKKYSVSYEVIGVRPCAKDVPKQKMADIINRATGVLSKYVEVKTYPASTDCNVFLSNGIPSVCLGVILGGGAHTLEEYIETESVKTGLKVAMDLVATYFIDKK